MNPEDYTDLNTREQAMQISEIFEQDSRRYNRALTEEQEAMLG